jgi:RNA polymerase sigma factor (sigma-70 family)
MRDDPTVIELVTRARENDQAAWDELVERYTPLVWSVCRGFRLSDGDGGDVVQNVWLYLVEKLNTLREAAALPGWIVTTTRRECIRIRRRGDLTTRQWDELDANQPALEDTTQVDQWLLAAERGAALREAFADLPLRSQQLMLLLIDDPPRPYAEISRILGIPIGAIGPSRARCLAKLRQHAAITALYADERDPAGGGAHHEPVVER